MPNKKKMWHLDLSKNKLTVKKESNLELAKFASRLPSLKELNLSSSKIGADFLKPIIECIPKLTILDLSNNEFEDEGK
jgi:hypothetical protein